MQILPSQRILLYPGALPAPSLVRSAVTQTKGLPSRQVRELTHLLINDNQPVSMLVRGFGALPRWFCSAGPA